MNNLEEWKDARETVKAVWGNWGPHFELLVSGDGGKIRAFFLLNDASIEWDLYHKDVPDASKRDFADYMEGAKEELLERVGFKFGDQEEGLTKQDVTRATEKLLKCMEEYEEATGLKLPQLTYNMLFYSEWLALPEEILEGEYENMCGE